MMRQSRLLVILVAAAVVVATLATFLYFRTRAPDLSIEEGSVLGAIEGNLTAISSGHPLVQNFSAITYANQSGGPSSTVKLRVQTMAFYVVLPGSTSYLDIEITVQVTGRMASNLHLTDVVLAANGTGTPGSTINFEPANQTGSNVTFDANQDFGITGTGSGQVTATPTCGGTGEYCYLAYGGAMSAWEYLDASSPYIGLRGTITVSGVPIGVGILLAIITT